MLHKTDPVNFVLEQPTCILTLCGDFNLISVLCKLLSNPFRLNYKIQGHFSTIIHSSGSAARQSNKTRITQVARLASQIEQGSLGESLGSAKLSPKLPSRSRSPFRFFPTIREPGTG